MFFVYILQNAQGGFYIGQTQNIEARMESHNNTELIRGKFTRKNGPWTLVWSEAHSTRADAMQREKEIKNWKSASRIREHLLSGRVPPQRD